MAFLHALHRLEIGRIHFIHGPYSAEHGMHDAGGPVHGESQRHQAIDNGLNLLVRRTLLHHH